MNGNGNGIGDLFREIGHTLEDVSSEVLSGTATALRTAVARQALSSPEGAALVRAQAGPGFGRGMVTAIIVVVALLALGFIRVRA